MNQKTTLSLGRGGFKYGYLLVYHQKRWAPLIVLILYCIVLYCISNHLLRELINYLLVPVVLLFPVDGHIECQMQNRLS